MYSETIREPARGHRAEPALLLFARASSGSIAGFVQRVRWVSIRSILARRLRLVCVGVRAGRDAVRAEEEDYLTGLPTRRGFVRCFGQLPADSRVTIFYVDLDNFKTVNDVYGHNVGDNVLRSVAHLFACHPDIALAARMGGDEFALVSTTILQRVQTEHLMEDLFASIRGGARSGRGLWGHHDQRRYPA